MQLGYPLKGFMVFAKCFAKRYDDKNIACIFCAQGFPCAYLCGHKVPVDAQTFCRHLIFGSFKRKQIVSYIRDHYAIKHFTAKDVFMHVIKDMRKWFVIQAPHNKPLKVGIHLWEGRRLLPIQRRYGMLIDSLIDLLARTAYRQSVCLPFFSVGAEASFLERYFKETIAFDNHPFALQMALNYKGKLQAMMEGYFDAVIVHDVKAMPFTGTFYPVRFSEVPSQNYSLVLIDSTRCESRGARLMDDLYRELRDRQNTINHRTLVDLLLDRDGDYGEVPWLGEVVEHYIKATPPAIVIYGYPFEEDRVIAMLQDIRMTLPKTYMIQEGVRCNDGVRFLIFITKRRGKYANYNKETHNQGR